MGIEDKLVNEWSTDEKRTLVDLVTKGKLKHGGTGKYKGTEGGPRPVVEIFKDLKKSQQEEFSKEIVSGSGVTKGDIYTMTTGGVIGSGPKSMASYIAKKLKDIAMARRIQSSPAVQYVLLKEAEVAEKKLIKELSEKGIKITKDRRAGRYYLQDPAKIGDQTYKIERQRAGHYGKRKGDKPVEIPKEDPDMPW
jgi:hypothetical protein